MADRRRTPDPARTLALLWRTHEPPSRKGGPGLSVDRIVRTAIEIADAEGLERLSMRGIAERLGVGTMSLYTYVPGKAELVDAMVDAVCAETARPAHEPGRWREALAQIARENWALYHRHPWLLDLPLNRAVLGPNVIAKYDYELQAVDGIGLDEIEMDAVLTLVLAHVRSSARAGLDVTQAAERTGMTDDQWWALYGPVLARFLDPDRYPTAARVGAAAGAAHQGPYDPEHVFEFGLERVLDGIAALVDARRAGSDA